MGVHTVNRHVTPLGASHSSSSLACSTPHRLIAVFERHCKTADNSLLCAPDPGGPLQRRTSPPAPPPSATASPWPWFRQSSSSPSLPRSRFMVTPYLKLLLVEVGTLLHAGPRCSYFSAIAFFFLALGKNGVERGYYFADLPHRLAPRPPKSVMLMPPSLPHSLPSLSASSFSNHLAGITPSTAHHYCRHRAELELTWPVRSGHPPPQPTQGMKPR